MPSIHTWLTPASETHLVPEDQGYHATDELNYEANPKDVHELKNKIQKFTERGKQRAICSKVKSFCSFFL